MVFDWAIALGLFLTALISATVALLGLVALQSRSARTKDSVFCGTDTSTVVLFDGDVLVDASPSARALLANSPTLGGPWLRLVGRLGPHFPDLEARTKALSHDGQFMIASAGATAEKFLLHGQNVGGLTRLTLIDPTSEVGRSGIDATTQLSLSEEVKTLRRMSAAAPILIWRERPDGEVIWANFAYIARASVRLEQGQDLSWPLPRMFDRTASTQGATGQRQRLDLPDGPQWFDLVSVGDDTGRNVYAMPADSAVTAETGLREFMHTLTKTFAHLPIGLAIFGRHRQLQLFNPALLDLTTLQADFLSSRPSLMSFLDAMRDRQMIPEPKDYRSWRRQMMELEEAASSGHYEETWSLPGGQTYRIIGRPHPNGALALMFEDISTEMSRTRRYRSDLELGQSVFDALENGLAVFSQSGNLVLTNSSYIRLWKHDPSELLSDAGIRSLARWWRDLSAPSLIWDDAESYVFALGEREAWEGETRLLDGRLIRCRFAPLAGGATLVTFRFLGQETGGMALAVQSDRLTA